AAGDAVPTAAKASSANVTTRRSRSGGMSRTEYQAAAVAPQPGAGHVGLGDGGALDAAALTTNGMEHGPARRGRGVQPDDRAAPLALGTEQAAPQDAGQVARWGCVSELHGSFPPGCEGPGAWAPPPGPKGSRYSWPAAWRAVSALRC